ACALRAQSRQVEIYERASELGEVGAGLQLGPNAVKVLRALGIEAPLRKLACEPRDIVSVAFDDAHLRFREPLKAVAAARFGAPPPTPPPTAPPCRGCWSSRCRWAVFI